MMVDTGPIDRAEMLETIRKCGKDEESRLQLIALFNRLEKNFEETSSEVIGILDDDKMLVRYMDSIMRQNGFKTLCATNAKAFFNLCESQKPSAVLLDINMPDLDGGEIMNVFQSNPDTADIPIIFMSGIIDPKEENCLNKNSIKTIRYIAKPFETERIVEELNEVLNRAPAPPPIPSRTTQDVAHIKLKVTRRVNSSGQMVNSINYLLNKVDELMVEWKYGKEHLIPVIGTLFDKGKVYVESDEFAERWELTKKTDLDKSDVVKVVANYA